MRGPIPDNGTECDSRTVMQGTGDRTAIVHNQTILDEPTVLQTTHTILADIFRNITPADIRTAL